MPHHHSPSLHPLIYRRIAISFAVLTIILALCALILTRTKATILMAAEEIPHRIEAAISVEPSPLALKQDAIPGTVEAKSIILEGKAPVSEGPSVPDHAYGVITVVNNYNRSQPLVATTRFLSENGILFRSTKAVTVPAGGKVTVEIRADKTGAEGNVPAGKFTIPGLWTGIQDKIYGTSDKPMTGGVRNVSIITDEDIVKATASLASEAEAVLYQTRQEQKENNVVVGLEKIKEAIATPVGKEAEAAIVQGTYRMVIVTYDQKSLDALLNAMMERRAEFASRIEMQNPEIAFSKFTEEGALINVVVNGTVSTPLDPSKINKKLIVGKKVEEAKQILEDTPGVGNVEIVVKPGFLKRLPRLKDRIELMMADND